MTMMYGDYQGCIDDIIARVGKKIVIGIPLGLGKPIGFINALYKTVAAYPDLSLVIITALTLARPVWRSELEKSFAEPILQRILGDFEDPIYEIDRVKQRLPPNINVIEFYLTPGKYIHNNYVQQDYISSKYTSVVQDALHHRINVVAQQVSRQHDHYSLSSNTDLFRDLLDAHKKEFPKETFMVVAEVNNNMPYMHNDAIVHESTFTHIVDPKKYHTIFAVPRDEVSATDHMIGIYTSTLIKDGGSLQIGIGTLSTAVADALVMRQNNNKDYTALMRELNIPHRYPSLLGRVGGTGPFQQGLYANTEMLSDEYIHFYKHGIIKKRVYDHLGLQTLLNENEISENVTLGLVHKLVERGIINPILNKRDLEFLQKFGIFKKEVKLSDGFLHLHSGKAITANLKEANDKVNDYLGHHLETGKLIHAGFFLGSIDFYQQLRLLSEEEHQQIEMTRISRTNSLLWSHKLAVAQRQHARFINSAMLITLSGAIVSDGLADLHEVSGVGGQFDFVNMAQELPDARSIIICRSTREVKGLVTSNVLWTYPNMTIPRYLRDIVITEYGIADCRSRTDCGVIKELLNVADSRFQAKLLKQAQYYGKISKDYHIPELYRHNYPDKVDKIIKKLRSKGYCIPYPFGTELTDEEIIIKNALLAMNNYNRRQLVMNVIRSWFINGKDQDLQPYFARMQMEKPKGLKKRIYKDLIRYALKKELE